MEYFMFVTMAATLIVAFQNYNRKGWEPVYASFSGKPKSGFDKKEIFGNRSFYFVLSVQWGNFYLHMEIEKRMLANVIASFIAGIILLILF